ncbi:twin-arginine translocase subunit TatC [Methanosarcina mazei]|uniref:Sec-independent protein translocase protein TatC n=1 Tax=Methanosarcina mazei SarPi TaxID=1434115 RepID=A0A0E3R9M9_METMZ|nr:twin-arginine translocase subunit TatC [Methanosarcina mazei]AKB61989.1 Twin-arginine translocation protein TatC [Methanosarcina mazei SarPi]
MDSQQTGNVVPSTNASGKNSYASGVPGDVEEPVMAHLFELRNRLAIVLIWLVVGIIISFPFSARGMLLLWKEFIGPGMIMSAYSPLEWTLARLKLCLIFALAISIPLFFYELYRFAAKGLYPNERRFFIKVIPASFLLFMLGTAIGYFLVLPVMFRYILFYSGDMATAQLSVQNTVSAVTTILAGFGVVFQLPLLVVFAVKMGLVQYQTLKKQRILVYSAILAFSLFITPDPTFIAQIVVAILLAVLFEFSLLLVRLF